MKFTKITIKKQNRKPVIKRENEKIKYNSNRIKVFHPTFSEQTTEEI